MQGRKPGGVWETEGKWEVSEQEVGRGRRIRGWLDHPLKCLSMVGHCGVFCAHICHKTDVSCQVNHVSATLSPTPRHTPNLFGLPFL